MQDHRQVEAVLAAKLAGSDGGGRQCVGHIVPGVSLGRHGRSSPAAGFRAPRHAQVHDQGEAVPAPSSPASGSEGLVGRREGDMCRRIVRGARPLCTGARRGGGGGRNAPCTLLRGKLLPFAALLLPFILNL